MDAQAVYPASLVDGTPLQAFGKWYTTFSRDPIMTGILGRDPAWGWMMPFFWLEMVFQIPCFILGAIGLWKSTSGSRLWGRWEGRGEGKGRGRRRGRVRDRGRGEESRVE